MRGHTAGCFHQSLWPNFSSSEAARHVRRCSSLQGASGTVRRHRSSRPEAWPQWFVEKTDQYDPAQADFTTRRGSAWPKTAFVSHPQSITTAPPWRGGRAGGDTSRCLDSKIRRRLGRHVPPGAPRARMQRSRQSPPCRRRRGRRWRRRAGGGCALPPVGRWAAAPAWGRSAPGGCTSGGRAHRRRGDHVVEGGRRGGCRGQPPRPRRRPQSGAPWGAALLPRLPSGVGKAKGTSPTPAAAAALLLHALGLAAVLGAFWIKGGRVAAVRGPHPLWYGRGVRRPLVCPLSVF